MRIPRLVVLAATLIATIVPGLAFAAAFTPGNLVVYRVGDGSAALNANATAVFLDEYTTAGAFVQTIALPTVDAGGNQMLTASGSSTTEGQMSRSADGTYLVLTGYDAAPGTTSITTSASASIARVVGRVDSSGSIDTSTALANGFSGGNPRGVASADGTGFWLTGSNTGVMYALLGATTGVTVSSTATNLRAAGVYGGQVYISSGAGTIRMGAVGTGMPTTTGQTTTALPGIPTAAPPAYNQFAFADLDGAVAGVDTLYACDEGAGGGVQKYSLVLGTWTSNGVVTGTCRGLTISVSGTTVNVYVTNSAASNIQTVTDTSGYNAPISGTLTTLASAGTNKAFRGIAFVPVAATPDLTVSVAGPANAIAGVNYDYTLTVANANAVIANGVSVAFTLPSGVTYVSTSGAFSGSESGGVVTLTAALLGGQSQSVATVTVTPTAPGVVNLPAGAGVVDPGNTIAESNEGNNTTTQTVVTTVIDPNPDLTASISGPANAVVSTNYDYTITISNGGGSAASPVQVNFALPSGVTYVGSTPAGGFSATLNGSTVEFTGGTVGTGSPVVLTVTVTAPAAPTTVTASPGAVVADPSNAIVESDEGNNTSTETVNTTIVAASQPDLTVSISGPPTGTTYTNYDYSITVANSGTAGANPTRVDFALPSGVTYIGAATAGGFSATLSGSTVQFTGGNVTGSGNVVLTVTVKAPGTPTTVNVAAGAVVADPFFAIAESDEGNNASTTTVATVVSDPANLVKIHDIQGNGPTSPVTGQVKTVDAIVTGYFPGLSGFFIQEEDADADADPATSEGIFVFNSTPVNPGDFVRVQGTVTEFVSTGITVTELGSATVTLISTGNPLPSADVVSLPVANSTFLERYEGMRVTFTQTLTVTDTFDLGHFGEVTLSANGRLIQPTNFIDPNDVVASGTNSTTTPGNTNVAAVLAQQDLNTRSSILIEDGSTASFPGTIQFWDNTQNTLRLGSTADNLTGVMHHAFGSYRVLPQAITWTFAQRPLTPPPVGASNLKVGGMNTLNYFNGDGLGGGFPTSRGANSLLEFNRQRAKTIAAIHQLGADIVGLMEMENDGNGPNSAIQDLVNGLNGVAGPGTWAFITDPPGYGTFPGGTDLIKPAIIYKTAAVTPVGIAMASPDIMFANARAPVAQTFQLANGERVTVVANHFKSKGSGGSGQDLDQNDGQGFFNFSRKNQASALINFVNGTVIPNGGDPKVILLGDFNAYEQEDPMDVLRSFGYTALASGVTSYSFDGQSGALDHALVSAALAPKVTGADKWHINADEPTVIDYNVENKNTAGCSSACTQPDYYTAEPFRVSDHDPVLVGLSLVPDTFTLTAVATGPGTIAGTGFNCPGDCTETVNSGTVVVLTATASANATFVSWTGCDSVTTNQCTVTVTADRTATATFALVTYSLTVTKDGAGTGTVTSTSPASPSINCGATCNATYDSGTVVMLTATADSGSAFAGWSGACTGMGGCSVTMDAAKTVTATFTVSLAPQTITFNALANKPYPSAPFTVSATGGGSGNPVVFSSLTTGVCTTSGTNGTTVTIFAAGTCTIAANQAGNGSFTAAPQVTQSFAVTGLFRAYLSKNGSDANPCTLTQPCRLLPAALTVVNEGGEIWMLDSANYNVGTVAVFKSVTILAVPGALGSVVANGADAILVNSSTTIELVLRNVVILNLSGAGNYGIRFLQGSQVTVEGSEIYGMDTGILVAAAGGVLTVKDTMIRDTANQGVVLTGGVMGSFEGVTLANNLNFGVQVIGGAQAAFRGGMITGSATGASVTASGSTTAKLALSSTEFSGNGTALAVSAATVGDTAQSVLEDVTITHNVTGVAIGGAGSSVVFSRQNNALKFNGTDVTGGALTPQAAF